MKSYPKDDHASTAKHIRKRVVEFSYRAGAHHIGSCLSCVEILVALNEVMQSGDKLILSAGHKVFALYAALSWFKATTMGYDFSKMYHHPEKDPNLGIEATTGSLGHGLSIGLGMAMAAPYRRIFVLMSDGELNEGSVWEAIMFAGNYPVPNLTMIIDYNRQQALGDLVIDLEPLSTKLHSFHWRGSTVSGHSVPMLIDALNRNQGWPTYIIAHTIKGYGVSFMERNPEWHYKTLDEKTYEKATKELA